MGILEKGKIAITNFLSNRTNLTIFQCLLYYIVGHLIGRHLTWTEMGIMFILMFLIQFITRVKGVSDGMVMRQLMDHHKTNANEFIRIMKREADKIDKDDIN